MHIEAKNLVKKFKEHTAVDRVSLRVEKGEIVGLLGPNGAGKTTSFYMIVGLEQPSSGEVFLSDVNITKMPMYKRAELGISYLTQESSIFRKLTVEENIMAILETTDLSRAEQRTKFDELLEEFHITHVRNRKGTELSGGERRRVEIARCLALEPQFILLDEPFAGVDPLAVADIQEIIQYLRQRGMVQPCDYIVCFKFPLFRRQSLQTGAHDFRRTHVPIPLTQYMSGIFTAERMTAHRCTEIGYIPFTQAFCLKIYYFLYDRHVSSGIRYLKPLQHCIASLLAHQSAGFKQFISQVIIIRGISRNVPVRHIVGCLRQ